ncbi:sugar kinase [Rathayibacter sp. VKM Ac-2856]|uniref:sugar kinase n=1 Tax=unclassified Rathayibacter TaxID=2609250 RepID=UPI001563E42F|nr:MULTISPECIES: sugar kinase [unclassified Rathayibacter]NQX03368.1 sugar kinase [Rathayibacter sp. VKM Ac-2858]NQX18536.1 sugar kinase [Rathayibacter sp. VKM Ac-2856]
MRVVTVGEALAVFRSSVEEPLWRADRVALGTGGAEANVAMTLAHRGIPVTWAGRVGDDALGRRVIRELRAEGVHVLATVDSERPTGLLVKDLHPGGRTTISYYRANSAGSALAVGDLAGVELGPDVLVHVTGITAALSAGAAEAIVHLIDAAREAGSLVSFDVNHRPRLWGTVSPIEHYTALASRADVVFASLDEVPLLMALPRAGLGSTEQMGAAAAALAEAGYSHVVVTAGAAGSAARENGTACAQPALPTGVVDSVGAGDAFVGGYLSSWLRGEPMVSRLHSAAVSGAAACRSSGDWEGAVDLSGVGADDTTDLVSR